MKILINKQQLDIIGDGVTKLIMTMYKDVLCGVNFDMEPDDDGTFWVFLFFKESWYDTLENSVLDIRRKSKEIRDLVYNVISVKIRTAIGLKNC